MHDAGVVRRRGAARWLAAIALIVGSACSADEPAAEIPSPSPLDPTVVTDAVTATAATGSASLQQVITWDDSAVIPDGTRVTMTGSTSFGPVREAVVSGDFSGLGIGSFEMQIAGTDLYLGGALMESLDLRNADWLYVDLSSSDPAVEDFAGLSSGTNDASLLLYYLLGVVDDVREEGAESIDGVPTMEYSLSIDLNATAVRMPEGMTAVMRRNLNEWRRAGAGTEMGAHVWIDGDGLIRRTEYATRLAPKAGGGWMTLAVELGDFGEPVPLTIPPPGKVVPLT
jgi:hypothetical protein